MFKIKNHRGRKRINNCVISLIAKTILTIPLVLLFNLIFATVAKADFSVSILSNPSKCTVEVTPNSNVNVGDQVMITVTPNSGYIIGIVQVWYYDDVGGIEGLDAFNTNSYTVTVPPNTCNMEVVVDMSEGYTVTFKVVNGSWNDGTTSDKTVGVYAEDGRYNDNIPQAGNMPNDGFVAGSWSPSTPSTSVHITSDTTYIYTYEADTNTGIGSGSVPGPAPRPNPSTNKGTVVKTEEPHVQQPPVYQPPVYQPPCEHTYEWTTITETTATADGEEALVCTKCGDTKERRGLAAMGVFDTESANKILKAAPGATVYIECKPWNSFGFAIKDAMTKRPDVTVKASFLSDGHKGIPLKVTIPAGRTDLFDNNGYLGLCRAGSELGYDK